MLVFRPVSLLVLSLGLAVLSSPTPCGGSTLRISIHTGGAAARGAVPTTPIKPLAGPVPAVQPVIVPPRPNSPPLVNPVPAAGPAPGVVQPATVNNRPLMPNGPLVTSPPGINNNRPSVTNLPPTTKPKPKPEQPDVDLPEAAPPSCSASRVIYQQVGATMNEVYQCEASSGYPFTKSFLPLSQGLEPPTPDQHAWLCRGDGCAALRHRFAIVPGSRTCPQDVDEARYTLFSCSF